MKKLILFFATLSLLVGCKPKLKTAEAPADIDSARACISLELPAGIERPAFRMRQSDQLTVSKPVSVYYEIDYSTYLYFNSDTAAILTWFQNATTQVQRGALLADSISIRTAGYKIWRTQDNYGSSLTNFGAAMAILKPKADMAQLLTRNYSGGIAFVDVFCVGWNFQVSMCGIDRNVLPYPSYSWCVEVMWHELMHCCGAHHSFDCLYNGNNSPIDSSNRCFGIGFACVPNQIDDPRQLRSVESYFHGCAGGIILENGLGWQIRSVVRSRIAQFQNCLVGDTIINPPSDSCTGIRVIPSISISAATNIPPNKTVTVNSIPINGGTRGRIDWYKNNVLDTAHSQTYSFVPLNGNTIRASLFNPDSCVTSHSATSNTLTFAITTTCAKPTGMFTDRIGTASPRANWAVATGAIRYNLEYKKSTDAAFTVVNNVLSNTYSFTGLPAGNYSWAVQTVCLGNATPSAWSSPYQTFAVSGGTDPCLSVPIPTVTFSYCVNSVGAYTFSSAVTTPVTFQWYKNGTAIAGAMNAQLTGVAIAHGDVIKLTVISADTCHKSNSFQTTIP